MTAYEDEYGEDDYLYDDEDPYGDEDPPGYFEPFFCHFYDPRAGDKAYLCGGWNDGSHQWGTSLGHQSVGADARCTAGCGRFRCQACLHEAIKRGYFPESARKHIYKGA